VGMQGWVRAVAGMDGQVRSPMPEYNVAADVAACRVAFEAGWDKTITPIDTCGTVVLRDERYRRVRGARNPLMQAVLRNYEEWTQAQGAGALPAEEAAFFGDQSDATPFWHHRTPSLCDTLAVYLAYDDSLLNIERLPVTVDDDGLTCITHGGAELRVATSWRDRGQFEEHLTGRLTALPATSTENR
jgi:inosine-uridine nucleoside N-ribohydrolase